MPILKAGDVYLKLNHTFRDGTVKDKYLVLVNTPKPGVPQLGSLTTSKLHHRPGAVHHCNPPYGIYAIPVRASPFPLLTHVLFDNDENCLAFDQDGIQKKIAAGEVIFKFSLPGKMTQDILACIRRQRDFLPGFYYELL